MKPQRRAKEQKPPRSRANTPNLQWMPPRQRRLTSIRSSPQSRHQSRGNRLRRCRRCSLSCNLRRVIHGSSRRSELLRVTRAPVGERSDRREQQTLFDALETPHGGSVYHCPANLRRLAASTVPSLGEERI